MVINGRPQEEQSSVPLPEQSFLKACTTDEEVAATDSGLVRNNHEDRMMS
jgi:hypothetical protein